MPQCRLGIAGADRCRRGRAHGVATALAGVVLLSASISIGSAATAASAGADLLAGPVQLVAGSTDLVAVACRTANVCEAVGEVAQPRQGTTTGVLVTITDGVASAPQAVPGVGTMIGGGNMPGPFRAQSIACPTATTCYAVVGNLIVSIVNGAIGTETTIPGASLVDYFSIACPTVSTCYAVGPGHFDNQSLLLPIVNGVPGTRQTFSTDPTTLGDLAFHVISCASANLCYVVGEADSTATGNLVVTPVFMAHANGVAGAVKPLGLQFAEGVACDSPTTCLVLGGNNHSAVIVAITGTTVDSPQDLSGNGIGLGCFGGDCQSVGGVVGSNSFIGTVQMVTNGTPSSTTQQVPGTSFLDAVACASATFCVAVGHAGSNPTTGVVVPIGSPEDPMTCAVISTQYPPAVPKARQTVQVRAADGLASISDIQITNGTVQVAKFTVGTTGPVKVVATKTNQGQPTSWSFQTTDKNGQTRTCT